MTPHDTIERDWLLLAEGASESGSLPGVPSLPTNIDTGTGRVRLALTSEGCRRLLIPATVDTTLPDGCSGEGIRVGETQFVLKSVLIKFIDVVCADAALHSVFTDVTGTILDRLASGAPPERAIPEVLDEYRTLLRRRRRKTSRAAVVGLLGELVVLREIASVSADAFHCWQGPDGHRHDFSRRGLAIEAKATLGRAPYAVTITSVDQLEEPSDGELYLAHVAFEETAHGAVSVASLVAEIVDAGVPRELLVGKVSAVGIELDDPVVRDFQASQRRLSMYRVDAVFPRIVASLFKGARLPDGVLTCQYVVDLATARRSQLDDAASASILSRMGRP